MNQAALIAADAKVMLVAGAGAGAKITIPTTLGAKVNEIVAGLAFVTASGAAATKALLKPTTDLTLTDSKTTITCVADQSANTLVILYR